MSISKRIFSVFILITLASIGLSAQTQRRASRISDRQVSDILRRLTQSSSKFRNSLETARDRNRVDDTRTGYNLNSFVRDFDNATNQLNDRFGQRRAVAADVDNVLQKAAPINDFINQNRVNSQTRNAWTSVRSDLTTLANAYGVSWQWQNALPVSSNARNPLTGTFNLDTSRSDNPRDIAERATRNLPNNEQQDVYDRILARLESPQRLAIERRGSTVTIASSLAPQSTFEADGVEHQEPLGNGAYARLTATFRGDQLVVSSNGYRNNDYNVTFEAIENGGRLRVRRQIYSDRLTQPVVVDSVYDRTSDVAQWNIDNGAEPVPGNTGAGRGEFIVRDGETVVAVLNNDLTTKQTKQGDRFTMTVREPGQYEGAVIEGTVGRVDAGGRLTGRSGMSLNFDTIRLRNSQTYKFAGVLGSVRTLNGDTVKVDNEGSAQGDNQTTQTIQRAGIGTAIGAIIGAIAGGGKGAAIGGIIGAAGGAGSVYVQGKDDLELPRGSELTIRASGPR